MKINLIDYTKNAEDILILAKSTRLNMSPELFNEIKKMSKEEKIEQLNYIFGTIKGSLEFVDFIFLIQDVTRAFTHQLVRHRVGVSFAQQSMRTVNMNNFDYLDTTDGNIEYILAMNKIKTCYNAMINLDIKPEDARGILPTNILTNIMMKINLRALSDMMSQRLCNRTQKEFREVMENIKNMVIEIYPWSEEVLKCYCEIHKHCFFKNGKGCNKYSSME